MPSLGEAFVDVRADTDKFPDDVRRAMRKLAKDVEKDTDQAGKRIGERLAIQLRDSLNERLRRGDFQVEVNTKLSKASVAATELALRRVTRDREVDIRINQRGGIGSFLGSSGRFLGQFFVGFTRILGDFFNFGRQIGQIFGEAFNTFSKGASGAASSSAALAAGFAQLAAAVLALAAVMTLIIGIFGVLLAAMSLLYQSILLILTLVPALGLAFILALGPMILIFTNLGEAIKATSGPLDDFNESIEDLGGNTQGVLRGLRDIVQFFIGIREEVQESFFAPINEALKDFDANLGDTFSSGFVEVSEAAGNFVASFIELFEHPKAAEFFENLFELAELGFEEIGGAGIELIEAFAELIDVTIPNAEDAVEGIADTIRGWADGIKEFARDEDLQETLDEWKESFNTIMELIGTAIELAQVLFNGFQEDGVQVLEDLNGQMERLIVYFESEEGQEFFDGLRVSATILLVVVEFILGFLRDWLEVIGGIEELFSGDLTDAVETFSNSVIGVTLFGWLSIVKGVADQIAEILLGWKDDVAPIFDPLNTIQGRLRAIADLARRIVEWFSRGWNRVVQLAVAARNAAGAFQPLLNVVTTIRNVVGAILTFARNVAGAVSGIRFPSPPAWLNLLPGLAEGGIFTRPTAAMIGEAGPEVVIPLTRPDRAMELVRESGLLNLIRGGDGASTASASVATSALAMMREMQLRQEMAQRQSQQLVIRGDGSLFARAVQEAVLTGMRTNPSFAAKVRKG
jgi:hypothetical protein